MISFDDESLLIVQLDLVGFDLLLEFTDDFVVIVIDLTLLIDLSLLRMHFFQLLTVRIKFFSLFILVLLCFFLSILFFVLLLSLFHGNFDGKIFLPMLLFDLEARLIPLYDALFTQRLPGYGIVFGERIVAIRTE